jgi:hypothetical protein
MGSNTTLWEQWTLLGGGLYEALVLCLTNQSKKHFCRFRCLNWPIMEKKVSIGVNHLILKFGKKRFHPTKSGEVETSLRGCISTQLCAHFFIFCTFFAPTMMINGASHKNSPQILSCHTFPWSNVFWKIWKAPPWLSDFCELEGVITPDLGSSFFTHHHSSGAQYVPSPAPQATHSLQWPLYHGHISHSPYPSL